MEPPALPGADPRRLIVTGVALAILVGCAVLWLFGSLLRTDAILTQEALDPYWRTEQYGVEIAHGNIPAQVLPDVRRGATEALPRFYFPLAYYAGWAFDRLTGDVVLSVNLTFFLAVVGSVAAMATAAYSLTKNPFAAAGAALVYLSVPYRFVDVFTRGALAESWAFVWFPLIVLGAWRAVERRRIPWYLPLAWCGLLLSHPTSALYFTPVLIGIAIVGALRRNWRGILALGAALVLGVGLGAWFLVPQQVETGDLWVSDLAAMGATVDTVAAHAVPVGKLLDLQHLGRGYSAVRVIEGRPCPIWLCGLDFAVGPAQVAMLFVVGGAALALFLALRRRRTAALPPTWPLAVVLGAVWLGSLVFVVAPRPFLTFAPSQLLYVQFPWRALAITAACGALLYALIGASVRRGGAVLLAFGVLLVLIVPTIQHRPDVQTGTRDSFFTRSRLRTSPAGDRALSSLVEYLPLAADARRPVAGVPTHGPAISGSGRVLGWHDTSDGLSTTVELERPGRVRLPITSYPFVHVSVDGQPVARRTPDGLVDVAVPAGRHVITTTRSWVTADREGFAITAISIALWAWTVGLAIRPRRRARSSASGVGGASRAVGASFG